jgi:hypothetical protein
MFQFGKPEVSVFPASSKNRGGKLRLGPLVTPYIIEGSKVLVEKGINTFWRLGNQSSLAMSHYGMEIYNNNTIMSSIYTNLEV